MQPKSGLLVRMPTHCGCLLAQHVVVLLLFATNGDDTLPELVRARRGDVRHLPVVRLVATRQQSLFLLLVEVLGPALFELRPGFLWDRP